MKTKWKAIGGGAYEEHFVDTGKATGRFAERPRGLTWRLLRGVTTRQEALKAAFNRYPRTVGSNFASLADTNVRPSMRGLRKRLRSGYRDGLPEDRELSQVFEQLKTLKEVDPTAFQAVKKVVGTLATSLKSVAAKPSERTKAK